MYFFEIIYANTIVIRLNIIAGNLIINTESPKILIRILAIAAYSTL